jgi:hypothetical protein
MRLWKAQHQAIFPQRTPQRNRKIQAMRHYTGRSRSRNGVNSPMAMGMRSAVESSRRRRPASFAAASSWPWPGGAPPGAGGRRRLRPVPPCSRPSSWSPAVWRLTSGGQVQRAPSLRHPGYSAPSDHLGRWRAEERVGGDAPPIYGTLRSTSGRGGGGAGARGAARRLMESCLTFPVPGHARARASRTWGRFTSSASASGLRRSRPGGAGGNGRLLREGGPRIRPGPLELLEGLLARHRRTARRPPRGPRAAGGWGRGGWARGWSWSHLPRASSPRPAWEAGPRGWAAAPAGSLHRRRRPAPRGRRRRGGGRGRSSAGGTMSTGIGLDRAERPPRPLPRCPRNPPALFPCRSSRSGRAAGLPSPDPTAPSSFVLGAGPVEVTAAPGAHRIGGERRRPRPGLLGDRPDGGRAAIDFNSSRRSSPPPRSTRSWR